MLPACSAFTVHVPGARSVTSDPSTVHALGVDDVNVTGNPDDAVAISATGD
jgi:hypothetical protein